MDLRGNDANYYEYPCVTYRAFGNSRIVQRVGTNIKNDDEILDHDTYTNKRALKVTTNRKNQKDIFVTYAKGHANPSDNTIIIQQVAP